MKLYRPILATHLTAVTRRHTVLHAVESLDKTQRPLCGYTTRTAILGIPTTQRGARIAMTWPPPKEWKGTRRCVACWELTGKKRPDLSWRDLKEGS